MNLSRKTHTIIRRQRGAAFMVMLVIMIIGVAAIFVASLNNSAIQIAQNQNTADSLAKAKEALIAYAGSDSNRPGELPCPDFNNDGFSEPINDYNGSTCKSLPDGYRGKPLDYRNCAMPMANIYGIPWPIPFMPTVPPR